MANPSTIQLQNFFFQNLHWFIILGLIVIVFIFLLKRFNKPKFKVVDRSEIERVKFIERMKLNKARPHLFFYHGRNLIGKIQYLKTEKIITNPNNEELGLEFLVIKPLVFFNKIPMGKEIDLICNIENIRQEFNNIVMSELVPIHNFSGIYYDETLEAIKLRKDEGIIDFIKNDVLVRTSFEDAMSVFYVKAMEQATFHPEFAQQTQQKQLDIEQEKEKRKRLIGS